GLEFSKKAKADIAKLNGKIQTARKAWTGMQQAMKQLNADIEASETRYQENLAKGQRFSETAKKAQEAYKTANWAEAGRWFGVATGSSAWDGSDQAATTSLKLLAIFEKEAITELKKKM